MIGLSELEVTLRNGDILQTRDGRMLPLKIMDQKSYNELWASLPPSERAYNVVPVLQSNGYACLVTKDFVACVGATKPEEIAANA
jgi:hypothetical protein